MVPYRFEIDGLRAVSIAFVILYHAGFEWVSGGYIGVDIFFVISGYLISSILSADLQSGQYSMLAFYERRARRILPALFLMLANSLLIAYAMLNPADLRDYAKSLLGSVLFLANITAYMQSGYFDAASDIKPLMHLWSLAIEEQYYVLFPLLLAFLWRKGRLALFGVIVLLCGLSIWTAEMKLIRDPSIAFFYLHSRAWELGIGALLALVVQFHGDRLSAVSSTLRQWLAVSGLCLIFYAILMFDKSTRFPGLSALVPTLGAGLVLVFATQETWVGRVLSFRPVVLLGLMSYSAYLWHQPIFAFARYSNPNHLETPALLGLIVLTFAVAYLSWRYVEAPFRNKGQISRRTIAWLSFGGIALFSAVALLVNAKDGFPERYPKELASVFDPYKVKEGKFCDFRKLSAWDDLDFCNLGDPHARKTVVLYGDSHASSLIGELDEELKHRGVKGLRVRLLNCNHSVPGMLSGTPSFSAIRDTQKCLENFEHFVDFVKDYADAVVVSIRWTSKMYPVDGLLPSFTFDNQEGGVEIHKNPVANFSQNAAQQWVTDGDAKKEAIWKFLLRLESSGKHVWVVYPVPEVGWDLPLYNFATYLQTGKVPADVSTSYALYKQRNRFVIEALDDAKLDGIQRIRPEDYFCKVGDRTRCMAQVNWQPYYYDSNHLASAGARPITQEIGRLSTTLVAPSKP
jgi:peptidoglycan/LPS O-acetylase OafA/YrhL